VKKFRDWEIGKPYHAQGRVFLMQEANFFTASLCNGGNIIYGQVLREKRRAS
jgi:hypothetical protein